MTVTHPNKLDIIPATQLSILAVGTDLLKLNPHNIFMLLKFY